MCFLLRICPWSTLFKLVRFYALVSSCVYRNPPDYVFSLAHMPLKHSFQALSTSAVLHQGPKSLCTFTYHSLAAIFLLPYMPSASFFWAAIHPLVLECLFFLARMPLNVSL
jgi:hypothetical protein